MFVRIPSSRSQSCKLLLPVSEGFVDGRGNASSIGPGDTVCLLPGSRSWIWIRYLHGTPEAPVVIMNTIGTVAVNDFYYGIKIDSCSNIKLSGKGVNGINYGIIISDIDGGAISVEGLSTDVEIEGLEIHTTTWPGLFCKTDPDCSFTSTRDKYVLRNVSIHDNYLHDIGTEGFYIGNSFYSGVQVNCGGSDTILLPHLIRGIKVYNNVLVRTGWDGIQVSCADSSCEIYGNEIYNDSQAEEMNQMSGIIVGEGSVCDCYNNRILYGKGTGIQIHGLGGNKIYNNLIVNSGRTYLQEFPYMNGIYIGDQTTLPGKGFLIAYNTIISPKDFGIDFRSFSSTGNLFTNNIVMNYGRGLSQGSNISFQNNLSFPTLDLSWFVDPGNGNYDLKPSAPAVNTAVVVSQLNLGFDILDRNRPFALLNDVGAYECHDPSLIAIPELIGDLSMRLTVEASGQPDFLIIRYTVERHAFISIGMYDLAGQQTEIVLNSRISPGEYEKLIDVKNFASGIYILRMTDGRESVSAKVQIW